MLTFAVACFLLIITPGPGVLSVAGVGSGFGFSQGNRYLWGLCLGNTMVFLLVATGVAAMVLAIPVLRGLLLTLSIVYMIYLAAKVAFAGSKVGFIEASTAPTFRDGLALQAINPKAYVANSLLFSGFDIFPANLVAEAGIKLLIWNLVWIPVHFGWLLFGITIRRLNLPAGIQRAINFIMAIAMLAVVGLATVNWE